MSIKRMLSAAALTALAAGASAHHGGAVEWGQGVEGPLTGVATEFAFRFPHVQLYIDVTDESGATEQWALVTRWTPTILMDHGWTRRSVEPGDTVTVTYVPHVSSPTVGQMRTIEVNGMPLDLDIEVR